MIIIFEARNANRPAHPASRRGKAVAPAPQVALRLMIGLSLLPAAALADIIGVSGSPGIGGMAGKPGGNGGNGAVAVIVTDNDKPVINEERLSGGAGGGGGGGGGGGATLGAGAPGGSGGQGGHGVELRADHVTLINRGLLQGGAGGGGGGGGGSAYSTASIDGGRGGDGIGGAGGGGGGGGDIDLDKAHMTPGNGGNAGQSGGVGTRGSTKFGGGGGGAGGSNNPFGCHGTGPDSGCGGGAGKGGGTIYGAAGGRSGDAPGLDGEDAKDATQYLTGGGGGGGAAPGGLGGKGGQAVGGPPSGAGGTSIGGYGIHVVGAHSEIINAGRIVPGVGAAQAVAIMYGPDAHDSILRLQGGSDIVGAVDATRSRGNRLILDGPGPMDAQTQLRRAFDVSKLGALGTNVATTDLYQGFTAFEKASPGTWELRGAPTQAHTPWTVTGGMLAIHGEEQLGSQDDAVKLQGGALQILDDTDLKHDMQVDGIGGILVENADARVQLRGRISGSGMLVKMGGGLLTVLSDNDFRGTTRVGTTRLDGRMRIGDGGSTGSLGAGPIEINAVLVIDRKDALTMHNPIRGEGDLIQRGDGTTTLRGPLAFAGHTYVDRGTLRIEDTTLGSRATGLAAVLALNPHPGSPPQQLLDLRHAVLNGWIDGVAQARIDRTSVWNLYIDDRYPREQMPDHSWVGALDLAGRLDFQDPRPQGQSIGRSVAIDSLTGRGGAVTLYVKPTADGVADHLVLAHGATGTTRVALKMQGAEGADPLAGDGLLIVQSGGKTDHAFVQDGESASGNRSGAFIYYLRHGGRPIGGVPRNPNNWYLGNEVRPEVSIYTQLGTQAARYGEISAGTLNARMGASEALANKVYPYAWGRLLSDVSRNDGGPMGLVDQRIATRTQLFGLQLGTDVHVVTRGLTRRSVGLYVSAATSNANVSHYSERVGASIPAGRSRLNAYGLGGYYTYFDGKGGYLDVVTQFSSFDARTRATQESLRLRSRGWGLLLSAEAGKSFAVGAEDANLRLEPQAQAIYQHISLGDSRDPASEVGLPTLDTLTARLGVRGSRTWNPARKNTGTAWLALDLLASVGRSASTYPSATQGRLAFLNRQPGPRVGLKLGYDRLVGRNAFVSVQGGTEQSLGGARSRNYTGNIGLKVLF